MCMFIVQQLDAVGWRQPQPAQGSSSRGRTQRYSQVYCIPSLCECVQNPDDMYAELLEQLDAVEGQLPLAAVSHIKPKDRGAEGDKDKEKQQERERQKEREKAQAVKAQLAARGGL